jgi:type IV pilus assembly protein PilA
MIVVAIIGVLATLAIFGVAKYLKNSKTAEATNSLGTINQDAVMSYSRERTPSSITTGVVGPNIEVLCPSSAGAIPATPPKGIKYTADPTKDYATDPGFTCLGFTMNQPQYFAYDYVKGGPSGIAPQAATRISGLSGTGWCTGATADFDGDGVNFIEFATGGDIISGTPVTSQAMASWDVKTGTSF